MLDLWKKDKSCKWFLNYERTKSQSNATLAQGLKGYGTKSSIATFVCVIVFLPTCCSFCI